eukprot:896694-Rhodomonas_salina.8
MSGTDAGYATARLKLSLLRCCMALLEGCVDGRQAEVRSYELRHVRYWRTDTSVLSLKYPHALLLCHVRY